MRLRVRWLRALAERARGHAVADPLGAAAGAGLPDLPALAALLWSDAAVAGAQESHRDAAATRSTPRRL